MIREERRELVWLVLVCAGLTGMITSVLIGLALFGACSIGLVCP